MMQATPQASNRNIICICCDKLRCNSDVDIYAYDGFNEYGKKLIDKYSGSNDTGMAI